MMRHYLAVKAQYPDHIVFYRMGDFFEMFGEDAKKAAPVLGITLTSRPHGTMGRTALAGVPHHAASRYLSRLLAAGFKVVVCEQTEDPKKAKGLVKRDVVEVLTPGADVTDNVFESESPSSLGAFAFARGDEMGLAVLDLSTGEFRAGVVSGDMGTSIAESRGVREVVVQEDVELPARVGEFVSRGVALTVLPAFRFSVDEAHRALCEHFGVATLAGFGFEDKTPAVAAAGAALAYVKSLRRGVLHHVARILPLDVSSRMVLDPATVRNLELVEPLRQGDASATLFAAINRTMTRGGGRLLRADLCSPCVDADAILSRQDAVAALFQDDAAREAVRAALRGAPDLARLSAKLGVGKAGPRDLLALADGCISLPRALSAVRELKVRHVDDLVGRAPSLRDVADEIEAAIRDDAPAASAGGGVIRDGYDPALDRMRAEAAEGKKAIAEMQGIERERTGISSLKVGFNDVMGYFIEVTKPNLSRVPDHYVRRQTLANAERFATEELKQHERKVAGAVERIAAREAELFEALRDRLCSRALELQTAAEVSSELDVVASLAEVARERGYVRPELAGSPVVHVEDGRHPVLERVVPDFVPNDVALGADGGRLHVITGPNMSGKSTYLRQAGLTVILAQIGSFVPASRARLGVVDRVFTRVGASDQIAAGRSTFLIEMEETALILHSATPRSLVLLDEVGRGTSTYDGLAIAWAVAEHLATAVGSLSLFATHFHELAELATQFDAVRSFRVEVKETEGKVVFLHRIVPGGCDDSYGIHVANLAGVPRPVLERAAEVLAGLEGEPIEERLPTRVKRSSRAVDGLQVELFEPKEDPIRADLRAIDADSLTPREALDLLAGLVERAKR